MKNFAFYQVSTQRSYFCTENTTENVKGHFENSESEEDWNSLVQTVQQLFPVHVQYSIKSLKITFLLEMDVLSKPAAETPTV